MTQPMNGPTGKRLNGLREIAEELSRITVASVIDRESQVVRMALYPLTDSILANERGVIATLDSLPSTLVGLLDDLDTALDMHAHWQERAERAEAALRAIEALHRDGGESQGYTSDVRGGYGMIPNCCSECGSFGEYGTPWPCPTFRAARVVRRP